MSIREDPVRLYYEALNGDRPWRDVPFHGEVRFRGPSQGFDLSIELQQMLEGLMANVGAGKVTMRAQKADDRGALSFYEFDMGLPDGPIQMAEHIMAKDGLITEILLIFDARRLGDG